MTCDNGGMPTISKARFVVYLATIMVLAGLLAFGEDGPFSFNSLRKIKIFRAPNQDEQVAFINEPVAPEDSSTKISDATKGDKDDFNFNAALNSLSSSESVGDGTPAATANAIASPQVSKNEEGADDSSRGANDADDLDKGDARQIFAGLQNDPKEPEGLIGGVVQRSSSLGNALDPLLTPLPTPTNKNGWVVGQARGYTMLYAMQPEARPVVESQVQALLSARIREPYIGVLIDGTFGRDFTYLKSIITRLSTDGRSLTLVLYLSNGPTMRKWRETPIDALFSRMDPSEFRQTIRRARDIQNQFLAVATQARDIFEFNLNANSANNNLAIVMLEDNLDAASYRVMRDLANEQLDSIAGFIRNPCLGCYKGNDDNTLGDAREEHTLEGFQGLKQGDGFSLDGLGFRYPNSAGGGISPAQLTNIMQSGFQKGLRYIGLWRHPWQGVIDGVPNDHPTERNFVPSNPDEIEFEIEALRTGLLAESDDGESP